MAKKNSPDARRRHNEHCNARRTPWYAYYRGRIRLGLETCRTCDQPGTRFGHLVANRNGGRYVKANLTILCVRCDQIAGGRDITHIPSLATEESWHWFTPPYPLDVRISLAEAGSSPERIAT